MTRKRTFAAAVVALIFAVCAFACLFVGCSGGEKESSGNTPEESQRDSETDGSSGGYTGPSETATGLTLSDQRVVFPEGSTCSVSASVDTESGSRYDGYVTWTTSDETVATVKSGNVTGLKPGIVTVTASVETGSGTAVDSCKVIVTDDKIKLNVGIKDDVKSFGYDNPVSMTYDGAEVELAYYIAEEMLCARENVTLIPLESSEREEALIYGDVDYVVATYSITDERSEVVNFSSPYYEDYVQVLVGEKYTAEGIENLSDFSDYLVENVETCKVGTSAGTTAYDAFAEYCLENGYATREGSFLYYENVEFEARYAYDAERGGLVETAGAYELAWEALTSGEIGAFVGDHSILSSYVKGGYSCSFLSDVLSSQQYGVGTAKDGEFTETVNAIVDSFIEDGTIAEILEMYGLEYNL